MDSFISSKHKCLKLKGGVSKYSKLIIGGLAVALLYWYYKKKTQTNTQPAMPNFVRADASSKLESLNWIKDNMRLNTTFNCRRNPHASQVECSNIPNTVNNDYNNLLPVFNRMSLDELNNYNKNILGRGVFTYNFNINSLTPEEKSNVLGLLNKYGLSL